MISGSTRALHFAQIAAGFPHAVSREQVPADVIAKVVEKFVLQLEAQLADRDVTIELSDEAAKWLIDTIKEVVPIWKQEHWADGTTEWVHPGLPCGHPDASIPEHDRESQP